MTLVNRNNRFGPDSLVKWKRFFVILSLVGLSVVFILLASAFPGRVTMFDRFYGTQAVEGQWGKDLLMFILYISIPLFLISAFGIVLNSMRHKRKSDDYSKLLIVAFALSLIGIAIFISISI